MAKSTPKSRRNGRRRRKYEKPAVKRHGKLLSIAERVTGFISE